MNTIQVGNFDYSKNEKGEWIYKAKEQAPLTKPAAPKYKEKPQFALNDVIEGKSKNRFRKIVNHTVIEVTKFIKDNI